MYFMKNFMNVQMYFTLKHLVVSSSPMDLLSKEKSGESK